MAPGTPLATGSLVRLVVLIVLATGGVVAADPLWDAEVRLGYGVALGGGGEMTSARATPLTISAIGSWLLREDPALSAYGGLVVETLDRNSVGGLAGVKLRPRRGNLRLMAGGTALSRPKTLWGASAGGGYCGHAGSGLGMCGDVMLTSFFAGTDLAPGHTVTQIQLELGLVFDAL